MARTSAMRSPEQTIISVTSIPAERKENRDKNVIDFVVCKSAREMKRAVLPGQMTLFADESVRGAVLYIPPNTTNTPNTVKNTQAEHQLSPNELFEQNQRLVWSVINVTGGYNISDRDDLAQQGFIALWAAAKKFDCNRGYQFSSYAVPAIRRSVFRAVEQLNRKPAASLEAMQEGRDDNGNMRYERFTSTDKDSPTELSENKEMIRMLFEFAEKDTPRQKEKKGIRALAMQVLGYDSKTIAKQIGVSFRSYTAIISAGRRALKNNPKLLSYISMIKSKGTDSVPTSILGDDYTVAYTDSASYDYLDRTSKEYLSLFAELLNDDEVGDCLLDEVRIGEDVVIIDEDYRLTTEFNFGMDRIAIDSVQHIKRKSIRKRMCS